MEASIGLLLPLSSITRMSKDYEKGLYSGLKKSGIDISKIEFVKEIIGQGGIEQVESALERLIDYHNVDHLTGILSNHVINELAEKFKSSQKDIVVSNLGEHVFFPRNESKFININSMELCKQCWVLGNWAVQQFGKKALIAGALYDSGYAFQMMFDFGMQFNTNDTTIELAICPMPEKGQTSDIDTVINRIKEVQPDFVFSLFCGEEATLFLEKFKVNGLEDIPILGLPFLLELGKVDLKGLKVYTPHHLTSLPSDIDANYSSVFTELGLRSAEKLALKLKGRVEGEQDKTIDKAFQVEASVLLNQFEEGNTIKSEVVYEQQADLSKDQHVIELQDAILSGWTNPYLGI